MLGCAGDAGAAADLGALQLVEGVAQCLPFFGPPATLISVTRLPCLIGSTGDAERRQGVHLRDGRLDDMLVQLAEGLVAAGRNPEQVTEFIERVDPERSS